MRLFSVMSNNENEAINPERVDFVYNGNNLHERPDNVTHLVVDSSVAEIPDRAFRRC